MPDPTTWPTRPMDATPPAAESIPGLPDRLGPFKLVKQLGRGGMGVVFLAEDTQLGRKAAVKVMRPEMSACDPRAYERFLREARAAAAVRHDNVVTVYQVGEENGVPYLAMELLRGTSLSNYLQKNAPSLPSAIRLGREIADGLAAAHARGLVHRDIKPGNIWLEAPNGRVKLLDFGLARAASPEASSPDRLTGSGLVVGTPGYMSPEQARGQELDERTDLFSLGVVLYLLCTGREPFAGANPMAVLTALAVDRQMPARAVNPKVPAALSDLIDQLLEKKPADRPASAAEVARALRQIERGQLAAPAPPLPPADADAPTYAMGQETQAAAGAGRPTEGPPEPVIERPKPRKTGARKKRRKSPRAAWLTVVCAGMVPLLVGATWLVAREGRSPQTKPAEVKPPPAKPATTTTANETTAEPKAGPPIGFPPPPPPPGGGLRPGMPGYGPPPGGGPGSPGFGPPPGFPPPKQ
jgi:serine/threonine protein kinase